MKRQPLTQAELHRRLHYDQATGVFTWRWVSPASRQKIGSVAGFDAGRGYLFANLCGRVYALHRLAWLYMTGAWPKDQLDHANCIRDDNSWANLREASQAENQRNRSKTRRNSSGYKGVSLDRRRGLWVAEIISNGKRYYLGQFKTPHEAHLAYTAGAARLHGQFARSA